MEALKVLEDAATPSSSDKSSAGPLGWIEVCVVKNAFITASCLDSVGRKIEARESYQAAVINTPGYRSPELRKWTERLLARACMYSVKKMPSPSLQDFSETYTAFRSWGDFWQRASSAAGGNPSTSHLDIPRRQVWKAYYDLLSTILQHGLLYAPNQDAATLIIPDASIPDEQRQSARRQQRAELKRVEATYESLLLNETKFPKASQSNSEVEEWTDQVITNWRIFSGSTWTDADLGDGGKRAVSRAVLDILYRAATKTFHSTPILRELFTVHAALGEFDLAMHAFDSYVEIVDKGKARAEKTGKHEIGLDSDDTAMTTAAEAVRLLCRYGDREQAERAVEIAKAMQKWLEQQRPASPEVSLTNGDAAQNGSRPSSQPTSSLLQPETLGAAYRALGVSQAHWARLTYEADSQRPLLADANKNLRRAQKYDADNIETAHALALVLADMRDVDGSVEVARSAIEAVGRSQQSNGDGAASSSIDLEKRLIPTWHLLALCSTAEEEYETAVHICEAAYRQFGGSKVLFGDTTERNAGDPEKSAAVIRGLVDQMEGFEKESLIQIKMTQILLFELTEGSDDATDLIAELLSLYSRLFGKPEQIVAEVVARPPPTAASHAPSKLGGTLRSITGSIRPKSSRSARSSGEKDTIRQRSLVSVDESLAPPSTQDVPSTSNGQNLGPPIAITVTNEDGVPAEKPHHRHHLPHLPFQKRDRSRSTTERRISEADEKASLDKKAIASPEKAAIGDEKKPDQPLGEMAHNGPHDQWPPPPGHGDHPPHQDVRLPAPHPTNVNAIPEPQLLPINERRHRVSVLVNAWLFSAQLYIRAETLDDAEDLITDALKLTESLELELAQSENGSNARRLFSRGWGSGKSIDELWADLWSTVSLNCSYGIVDIKLTFSQKALLLLNRERHHEAMAAYEQAISYYPDHPAGIIGLSNLLMDIYEEKLPAEQPQVPAQALPSASGSLSLINEARPALTRPGSSATLTSSRPTSLVIEPEPMETKERKIDPSPAELNRLAARDRAYMLLSNLTKHAGWDNSEAWLSLARAHELSKEIDKAKQALWWVVELEETQPIRPWREVTPGGYTV